MMNQTQAKLPPHTYAQLMANKLQAGMRPQVFQQPSIVGYPGMMPLNRVSMNPVAQIASTFPKQTTPTNLSLMNLIMENNLLRNQLQSLTPLKQAPIQMEIKPVQTINVIPQEFTAPKVNEVQPTDSLSLEKSHSYAKKKRYRRLAKQIERVNCCPANSCSKSYGSEGSLHQHIRLKHPDFDILTWIRDKIKNSETTQPSEKTSAPSNGNCKFEDSLQKP